MGEAGELTPLPYAAWWEFQMQGMNFFARRRDICAPTGMAPCPVLDTLLYAQLHSGMFSLVTAEIAGHA